MSLLKFDTGVSSNGRTADSGSVSEGSTPSTPAWPYRLTVRTPDSHSGNRGSIPLRASNYVYKEACMAKEILTYIGDNAEFNGKFIVKGSIKINGKFQGELQTDELIHIGPTGKVKTNIFAKKVLIEGSLIGNINASESVTIVETGRVMGDITTPQLKLGKGVVVNGKINITGGQPKGAKDVIKESFGEENNPKDEKKKNVPKSKKNKK